MGEKQTVRWEEKWSRKVKSIFTAWCFSSFTGGKKKRAQTFKLFSLPHAPSVSLSPPILLSNPTPPPRYLRTTPLHQKLYSRHRTTFQSHISSQGIDIIPSALFSSITLCYIAIWVISTEPWLGLRGALWLETVQQSAMSPCYLENSFNHINTETRHASYLTLHGAETWA